MNRDELLLMGKPLRVGDTVTEEMLSVLKHLVRENERLRESSIRWAETAARNAVMKADRSSLSEALVMLRGLRYPET